MRVHEAVVRLSWAIELLALLLVSVALRLKTLIYSSEGFLLESLGLSASLSDGALVFRRSEHNPWRTVERRRPVRSLKIL